MVVHWDLLAPAPLTDQDPPFVVLFSLPFLLLHAGEPDPAHCCGEGLDFELGLLLGEIGVEADRCVHEVGGCLIIVDGLFPGDPETHGAHFDIFPVVLTSTWSYLGCTVQHG